MDKLMTNVSAHGLTQHWVCVVDASGREHVEARWHDSSAPLQVVHAA